MMATMTVALEISWSSCAPIKTLFAAFIAGKIHKNKFKFITNFKYLTSNLGDYEIGKDFGNL